MAYPKVQEAADSAQWIRKSKDLLDSLNIGFLLLDAEDNVLEANESFLEMTGATTESIVGRNVRDFYRKSDYEAMRREELSLQRQGSYQYQFEFFLYSSQHDGKIPVLVNVSTNFNHKRVPVSQNVLITDISEQKRIQAELEAANQALIASRDRLRNEKNKLETILFGIGDCVTIFDLDGGLILSNPKGRQIRGSRATPLLSLGAGNQGEISLPVGEEKRYFFGQIEAIHDHQGQIYAFAEILRDITHQKRLEEREQELFRIKQEIRRSQLETELIGASQAMQEVFDLIVRCADVDSTVLITGETGVGKEMVAKAIHAQSDRRNKPFVAINCSAIPETLLESELFGHVKGAFTGAVSDRRGLFREAHEGTIFLDEVGDLSGSLQAKILRVLQEKEIRPVGGNQTYQTDVRVLAATHRDLQSMVAERSFRDDLYYRLAVITMDIPPLRERTEDVLPLADRFIRTQVGNYSHPNLSLDHQAQQILLDYHWPGNIRELANCIEHAAAMTNGPLITRDNLPVQILSGLHSPTRPPCSQVREAQPDPESARSQNAPQHSSAPSLQEVERNAILNALRHHRYNQTLAAADLGISRVTLWRKIKQYSLFEGEAAHG